MPTKRGGGEGKERKVEKKLQSQNSTADKQLLTNENAMHHTNATY